MGRETSNIEHRTYNIERGNPLSKGAREKKAALWLEVGVDYIEVER
jgi:hypothetical protein